MTDEELKALVASLAVDQKELTKKMLETDEKLKRVGDLVGNIGRNQGDVAEEFFFNSLVEDTGYQLKAGQFLWLSRSW